MTSRKQTPQFRNIKAVFEGFNKRATAPPTTHRTPYQPLPPSDSPRLPAPTTDEMPTPDSKIKDLDAPDDVTDTIDEVLDEDSDRRQEHPQQLQPQPPSASPFKRAPERSTPQRPALPQRPSWIGHQPSRAVTPDMGRQTITLTYASPGLRPPVYVATSFGQTPWEPVEMEQVEPSHGPGATAAAAGGVHAFTKTFYAVPEGEHQYKFRLGPGDWWVCDDSKLTIDDGSGNKNNLLVVGLNTTSQAEADKMEVPHSKREDSVVGIEPHALDVKGDDAKTAVAKESAANISRLIIEDHCDRHDDNGEHVSNELPLLPHESFPHPSELPKLDVHVNKSEAHEDTHQSTTGPQLFNHETFRSPAVATFSLHDEVDDEEDSDEELGPPLLRHETLNPDVTEETHSPLFRHETGMAESYLYGSEPGSPHSKPTRIPSADSLVCPEADPDDPSLERFPTDEWAIMKEIHRTKSLIPEDETTVDVLSKSLTSRSQDNSSPRSLQSLPSVREEDDDADSSTRLPSDIDVQDMVESSRRPADLMTPPMTPPNEIDTVGHVGHHHNHHHNPEAIKDMQGEGLRKRKIKHASLSEGEAKLETKSGASPSSVEVLAVKPRSRSSIVLEIVFGISLAIGVAAMAIIIAIKMHDSSEDIVTTVEHMG